ncbi:MAG TPA: NADH-quinone oxidoreductase subunit C [Rhodospirillaceae bacterium]|nr:NADH-quinone oxidoreductase subunit C [Rhodospirillaceae bacterium]
MIAPFHRPLADAVRDALDDIAVQVQSQRDELTIIAPREKIVEVMQALRDDERTDMHQLMDVCGVDHVARRPRFDVVYQLLSLSHNWRLTVAVQTDKAVPSVVGVYPSTGWFERETFDLFGITFDGHPDLRRILTDYDFEGHPLRRDFPLMGFEEKIYDDLTRRVVRQSVTLQQDYRAFDALSPWQGMTDVQKRGEND